MTLAITPQRLEAAIQSLANRLLAFLRPEGFWEGFLSSSALSTATAVSALALAGTPADAPLVAAGSAWLCANQNADGGWGDTTNSPSNLSTTLLCTSALCLAPTTPATPQALRHATRYATSHAGTTPADLVQAIGRIYGQDRTFAVPILMTCALAGLVPWEQVPGLPFELAIVPARWYKALRLHVVSYALPALIAIGLLVSRRHPPRNPLRRLLHRICESRALRILQRIQPEDGGFLEATPLTSFVALGLLPILGPEQPVAAKCLAFLRHSQRPDGSWPIDTNLSVWLTTASVAALAEAGQLGRIDGARTADWIAAQQHRLPHPYTNAAQGAWAWTHLPGGVPDADDTSGALIALTALDRTDGRADGVRWLLNLQNPDGGWPTFCRGWGKLPFDRSAPDVTAHALRALSRATQPDVAPEIRRAIARGIQYLHEAQQPDGSWLPLWFGSQLHPTHANPVLGTARVLRALQELAAAPSRVQGAGWQLATDPAVAYLMDAQSPDGGWGAAKGLPPSVEETALALSALCRCPPSPQLDRALTSGVEYLLRAVENGVSDPPAPIGLYFASLWYSERLYPLIWTLEALGRFARFCPAAPTSTPERTRAVEPTMEQHWVPAAGPIHGKSGAGQGITGLRA